MFMSVHYVVQKIFPIHYDEVGVYRCMFTKESMLEPTHHRLPEHALMGRMQIRDLTSLVTVSN